MTKNLSLEVCDRNRRSKSFLSNSLYKISDEDATGRDEILNIQVVDEFSTDTIGGIFGEVSGSWYIVHLVCLPEYSIDRYWHESIMRLMEAEALKKGCFGFKITEKTIQIGKDIGTQGRHDFNAQVLESLQKCNAGEQKRRTIPEHLFAT